MNLDLTERIDDNYLLGSYTYARKQLYDLNPDHKLLGLMRIDDRIRLFVKKPRAFGRKYGNASNLHEAVEEHIDEIKRTAEKIPLNEVYESLKRKIKYWQRTLRKRDSDHKLLKMIRIDGEIIMMGDFERDYVETGVESYWPFWKYMGHLRDAVRKIDSNRRKMHEN